MRRTPWPLAALLVAVSACSQSGAVEVLDAQPTGTSELSTVAEPDVTVPSTTSSVPPTAATPTTAPPVGTVDVDTAGAELSDVETPFSRTPRLEPLPAGFSLDSEAITDPGLLGPESSIYSMLRVTDTEAIIVGSVRNGTAPASATAWLVDMETGATQEQWKLPSIEGRPSVATDVVDIDDEYVVIGAQFAVSGAQGISWRISSEGVERTAPLTCDCASVEPEHVVVDGVGTLYVAGRVPGWQGYHAYWSSSDAGTTWSEPLVEPTGYNDVVHIAPTGDGAFAVYWSHVAEDWGWRAMAIGTIGNQVISESDTPVPVAARLSEIVDTLWVDGRVWLVANDNSRMELMSSPDGRTWTSSSVPRDEFARAPYVTPIGLIDVDDRLTILVLHGDGVADTITAMTMNGNGGFDSLSDTASAPVYQARYNTSFPAAATAGGIAVFDDGWTDGPTLHLISATNPRVVDLVDVPPTRREYRERVWSLSAADESVAAIVYRQSAAGPHDWVNLPPRVAVRVESTWRNVDLPANLGTVVTVVPSGRNHLIAATTVFGSALVEVGGDDGTIDVDTMEFVPFHLTSLIGTADGRLVASSSDGSSLWTRDSGEEWRMTPPLPGDSPTILSMCTDSTLTVALIDESSLSLSVMAYDGSSWSRLGSVPEGARRDPESPRCDVSPTMVSVAYRDLFVVPANFSAEMLSVSRVDGGAGQRDYFHPQWPGDRITGITRSATANSGAAVGLRDDAEYSFDAVAWYLDGSAPTSYVLLSGGPGIQESRAVVQLEGGLLVGGTDGGAAMIWSLPS